MKEFLQDLETLQNKKNLHENFIYFFGQIQKETQTYVINLKNTIYHIFTILFFSYYAVELCRYSVEQLIRKESEYTNVWRTLTREKILYQTALALDYLHGFGYIHGNIHQQNVLVAEVQNNCHVVKLSDFRSIKRFKNKINLLTPQSSSNEEFGPWTDVGLLGLFFEFVLFNNSSSEEDEAVHRKQLPVGRCYEKYRPLIEWMKKPGATDRPSADQILRHLENDKLDHFPLYDYLTSSDVSSTRPGLCVVFHQKSVRIQPHFIQFVKYLYFIIFPFYHRSRMMNYKLQKDTAKI